MIPKDYEYIDGSTARKLDYDVYEENRVLKAKKKYKNNRKAKFRLVMSMMLVLAAGLTITCRFAMITQVSYGINLSETKYSELRSENSRLRAQIEKDTDFASVKLVAETRLGLQMPNKSQIVYIKIPKNDYTVVMNTEDRVGGSGGGIFIGLMNKIAGFINLLG